MTGFIGIDKNSRRLEAVNDVSKAKGGELIPPGPSGTKRGKESSGVRIQLMPSGDDSLKPGLLEVTKAGITLMERFGLDV